MSGYSEGVRVEHIVISDLQTNGYETTRAASSKGVADVIGIKTGQVLLVNVKRTTMPGPAERKELLRIAAMLPGVGVPLVAMKPKGQPLAYRRLFAERHGAWVHWTPDEVAAFEAEAARTYASMIGDDLPRAELLAQQREVAS